MERKQVDLVHVKATTEGNGEFSGYGAVFGNVDLGGDRIVPGAFSADLPWFLKDGLIAWQHDQSEPVAMPLEAREDAHGRHLRAAFHSTDTAQRARRILSERLAAGKQFGMSIGYAVKEGGHRMVSGVRELTSLTLYEVSLVSVPMNPEAVVVGAKCSGCPAGGAPSEDLREAYNRAAVTNARITLDRVEDMIGEPSRPAYMFVRSDEVPESKRATAATAAWFAAHELGVPVPTIRWFARTSGRGDFTTAKRILGTVHFEKHEVWLHADQSGPKSPTRLVMRCGISSASAWTTRPLTAMAQIWPRAWRALASCAVPPSRRYLQGR